MAKEARRDEGASWQRFIKSSDQDLIDHDLIIESVNRKVSDGSVLKLIRKFLEAGVMKGGAWEETTIGSPQADSAQPWDEC